MDEIKSKFTWFQQDNGSLELTTCVPPKCVSARKVFWAWDRSLGSWVHYQDYLTNH